MRRMDHWNATTLRIQLKPTPLYPYFFMKVIR